MRIKEKGFVIKVYDPFVKEFYFPLTENIENSLIDSDCLIVVTDHTFFKNLNPQIFVEKMRTKNVIDTRNCLDKKIWLNYGFNLKTI